MGSTGKERLKWTDELHQLFEMAVHNLGGPDRATPKGILKAMEVEGLTIFHVKSHLQKYRMSKLVPESSNNSRDRYERQCVSELLPNFGVTSGTQFNEALQLYKQVQKHMSDQTEVQRRLKKKIEAQGRFLDMIKLGQPLVSKPDKIYSSVSLPFIWDESDLETEKNKMRFEDDEEQEEEETQDAKRLKKMENKVSKQCESISSFSWTTELSSACQSPLFYSFTN